MEIVTMPNNRVFYASQGVSVGGTTVQGAQSVGITTNFNLEQVFQLGQLALYDNVSLDPEVEITISKVLDGEDSIWKLSSTTGTSLIDNANDTSDIVVGVGSDTSATLTSSSAITCSGMFVSSVSYTFPVDGSLTEEVTFVGNAKALTGSVSAPVTDANTTLRRQNVNLDSSTLPTEVSGKNITSISISADLGRETMYKLGSLKPFHRFVNFPLEVTCEFEVSATDLDGVEVEIPDVACSGLPANNRTISISLCDPDGNERYTFDLGDQNKLTSVNYSGGDTGGGNATITYSYSTYNELTITDVSS
jgi:hypothetical protein